MDGNDRDAAEHSATDNLWAVTILGQQRPTDVRKSSSLTLIQAPICASNIELVAFENGSALHQRELGPMYGM